MLTKEQQKIVKHNVFGAAYLFVMAGPGTGKTHVLCHRVRYLIKKGVPAENILLLTFSTSAALNMASRLAEGFNAKNVRCSTTHAFGLSLVMEHWHELGFTARPKVKTKSSFKKLCFIVKKIAAQHHVDQKQLQIAVYKALKEGRVTVFKDSVNQVLERYQQGKLRNNWLDFADMLKLACQLLKRYPDILNAVGTIEHLLVDEVQDMTEKECQLLYYLAKAAKSAVLVGDKKQNIYSFRGVNPKHLQKLESYLKPDIYYLTESFRLPRQLLPLVNAIGADIYDAPELTSQKKGFKPALFCAANNDQQSDFIVKQIKKLLAKGVPADEIAILGRTRRNLIAFNQSLKMHNIDAVESYRHSDNAAEDVLKSLILITKWQAKAPSRGPHPFKPMKALSRVLAMSGLSDELQQRLINQVGDQGWDGLRVPKKPSEKHYRNILALRKGVIAAAVLVPEAGIQLLIDTLKPMLTNMCDKKEKPIICRDFSFIKTATRGCQSWSDVVIKDLPVAYQSQGIELTTAHGAKGREWQYVFLINFVEKEFPFACNFGAMKLNEERRLFFVAASRTSQKLTIVQSPFSKIVYNKGSMRHANLNEESSFITDYGSHLKRLN